MNKQSWRCKNGYAKVGDKIEFSAYNSVSGKPGETATIIHAIPIEGCADNYTLIFDDKTRCCSDKLWNDMIIEKGNKDEEK